MPSFTNGNFAIANIFSICFKLGVFDTSQRDEVVTKFRAGNSLFALLKIIIGTAAAKKVGCSQFSHLANVYLKVIKSLRQNSLKKF